MTRVVLWTTFMLGVGQIIENSRDGGETWRAGFDAVYRRVGG